MDDGKTPTRALGGKTLEAAGEAIAALRHELGGTSSLYAAARAAERGAALAESSGVALRRLANALVQPGDLPLEGRARWAGRMLDKSMALLATGLRLRAIARELRTPLEAELGLRGAQVLVEQGVALTRSY